MFPDDVPTAKKIYWKCQRLSSTKKQWTGRGQSNGLKPPFQITTSHNHIPTPKRDEVIYTRQNLKNTALSTNDNSRTIIRDVTLCTFDPVI